MQETSVVFSIFAIFAGAAALATVALFARQAMLVAYIALGAILGPPGVGLVDDPDLIEDIAHIGIIFLLFLLGLNLHPQKLVALFTQTAVVTFTSSALFGAAGFSIAILFGFPLVDCVIVGLAAMFSSTIIGLKLLPATVLHHRHTGELIISVLLMQDLIAIVALLVLQGLGAGQMPLWDVLKLLLGLPLLIGVAYLGCRYVILWLLARFDRIQEYVFLVAIGWCLGTAQLAHAMSFSYEIGAFIGGVVMAASPVARFIAESLRPLRDFFLVMFFFALGASFDTDSVRQVLLPALALALMAVALKPPVYRFLFVRTSETPARAWEIGVRLGQMSEFSLLVAFLALESGVVEARTASLVQLATIITFVVTSYVTILYFPTPMAVADRLRRD